VNFKRASNLFVQTNASGEIVSVFWPHDQPIMDEKTQVHERAPSQTGVALSDGEEMHRVAVPEELYYPPEPLELPADFFSNYDLQVNGQGKPVLVSRSPEAAE
jgi:hypothetical protein